VTAFGKPKDDDAIDIDGLNEVDDNPFYVTPGTYPAQCTACEHKVSDAGNPMLVFTMTLGGTDKDVKGKDLKVHAVLTPGALWKLKETLGALGFAVNTKKLKFKPAEAKGKRCMVKVVDKDYQGEKRSNVSKCSPMAAAAAPAAE
jgi:hypothetical protein